MRKNVIIKFITALVIIIFTMQASAQSLSNNDGWDYIHIDMQHGLPHNFIDCIMRDSKGFVWMGLGGAGLVRYDGYDFEHFAPGISDKSICGSFVTSICEDGHGHLWVASEGGIDQLDLKSMKVVIEGSIYEQLHSNVNNVKHICCDSMGNLWAIGSNHVWHISFDANGNASSVIMDSFCDRSILNSEIIIDLDNNSQPYIVHNGYLSQISVEEGVISPPRHLVKLANYLKVFDIKRHGSDIWIGSDIGLYQWNKMMAQPLVYLSNPSKSDALSQNYVSALTENSEGKLLVGTLNGLNCYDDASSSFSQIPLHGPDEKPSLSSNFVNCIINDGDNLWIGTEGAGALLISPTRVKASYHRFALSSDKNMYKPVNAICEDEEHTLWVGAVEGGLAYRRKGNEQFVHLDTTNSLLPHNSVSALASDCHGGIWVGTWGEGIIVLDRNNPSKSLMRPQLYSENNEIRPYIGALQYDSYNHGMWIGTSVGLFFYDMDKDKMVYPIDQSDNVNGAIGCAIDSHQHLWLGSFEGLYDIDLSSRIDDKWSYRKLEYKLDEPESRLRDHVTSVTVTHDGSLWVGSSVHGVYRRDSEAEDSETFVNYNVNDGIPHNSVMGILEDFQSRIWVSTNNGLACYDKSRATWEKVTGLPLPSQTQFYWNAYVFTSDGHLLFGSTEGMLDIDTRSLTPSESKYNVHLTKAILDGEKLDLYSYPTKNNICNIDFVEGHRTLQIDFSALDYTHDPSLTYFYRLEGFDNDWVKQPKGRHDVTYTNLSPGNYNLYATYGRDKEAQSDQSLILVLSVKPKFYNTWWFRVLCFLILCGFAFLLYQRKVNSMKLQSLILEQKVEERTHRINEQKRALEQRSQQIQELTVGRLSFFTNITHEFRTPITLILGPLVQMLKQTQDPKIVSQLRLIQRNANYLLSLVNQLMDFRKMESGKLEIQRHPGNFSQFLQDTISEFSPLADDRNISIDTICTVPPQNINFDKEAMRKLLHNFLTNALKYTPEGGGIIVRAAILPQWCHAAINLDCRKLYLSVSDTGEGLNPDDIDKIFDRFYQGKGNIKYPNAMSSSGIGLYLCKSIVEAYGGELTAKNNRGPGATFRVVLPIPTEIQAEKIVTKTPILVENDTDESEETKQHQLSVLVVEDNSDMRQYISNLLSPLYAVIEATNGREALELIDGNKVEIIVSDLMMPIMDGMELARQVKSNLSMSHIPIIMLTAKSNDNARLEGYATGVDDFITKPFNPDILLERISNIIKNKKRYQRAFNVDFKIETSDSQEETRDQKFLRSVMDVVKSNYKNSYFEVGDFAEELGVSRSFLNKKLQALIGESASQLMKNYRLKLAKERIIANRSSRSYTISEIAYDVGFNDSKYFTKCFVKKFGITPSNMLNNDVNDSL